jgi:hypothetical protein
MTFDALLSPVSVEQFATEALGSSPLLVNGIEERFAGLFNWDSINECLAGLRVDPYRIHVVKNGASSPVPYSEAIPQLGVRGKPLRLSPALLADAMRDGATVVVDAVDELHAPLRSLAQDIETQLGANVQVNLYVNTAQGDRGFGAHWDDHETIIVQVEGQKRWEILGGTMSAPLGGISTPPEPDVAGEVIHLSKGDLLYLPRGTWHRVSASGPTAHLTFGTRLPTGMDMFAKLIRRAEQFESVRSNIPRDASELGPWLSRFQSDIWQLFSTGDTLSELASSLLRAAAPRPRFTLPSSGIAPCVETGS